MEVQRVHPEVTEHLDSDSGKREFKLLMNFSELTLHMSVVYVLTTPMPEDGGDNPTNVETTKELWDTLEAKYMAENASSKKFLVSNFTNYKMTDSRPVLEQYNKLLGILGRFTQHKMNMDESIQSSAYRGVLKAYNDNKGKHKHHDTRADPNKKPKVTYWKCGKLGHLQRDCKAGNVGNKANGSGIKGSMDGSSNTLKAFMSTSKLNDSILSHVRLGHVHFKRMQDMSKDGLIPTFDMDIGKFYVIEHNDSVAIKSIIKSMDDIFDENIFSSFLKPSQRSLVNGTEDSGGSVVPEKVTDEVAQQLEPKLRKGKGQRTPKDFGPVFQLYLIEGARDEIFDQYSYCFNVEDDPKTFDEAIKSQDVAF
ncbi:zinc finger, CCHC-type containing protein [Tanacetum coccineum]